MSVFQGLYSYEYVMLVLGIVLFFFALRLIARGVEITKVSLLFVFAIIMIGYPSVQGIQYKDGVVTIQTTTDQLQKDPANTTLRTQLQTAVAQLQSRIASNSTDASHLASLASAQYALGHTAEAETTLVQASAINSHNGSVLALKNRIKTMDALAHQTAAVQADPSNPAATAALQKALAKASSLQVANPEALLAVAHAQAQLGEQEEASANLAKAMAIDPRLAQASHPEPGVIAHP